MKVVSNLECCYHSHIIVITKALVWHRLWLLLVSRLESWSILTVCMYIPIIWLLPPTWLYLFQCTTFQMACLCRYFDANWHRVRVDCSMRFSHLRTIILNRAWPILPSICNLSEYQSTSSHQSSLESNWDMLITARCNHWYSRLTAFLVRLV